MVHTSPKRGSLRGIVRIPAAELAQSVQLRSRICGNLRVLLLVVGSGQALNSAPLLVTG